jgi:peptidoglycan/LPS O-acetylase OafA/YrhL
MSTATGVWLRASRRAPSLPHPLGLDGFRGMAVIAVIAYHLDLSWTGGGFLGVEVFFTLSGFLITQLLVLEMSRTGRVDVRAFAAARARRLVPALVACVLSTVVAVRFVLPSGVAGVRDDAFSALLYVQNWHLALDGVPYGETWGTPSPLLHLWSLAVEGQLYVLWPALLIGVLAVLGRRRAALVALAIAVVSAVAMALQYDPDSSGLAYYATDSRASGFLVGAALALLWRPQLWSRRLPPVAGAGLDVAGLVALAALLVAFVRISEFDDALYEQGGFLQIGLISAVVIAAATRPRSVTGWVLGGRWLVWVGARSYGIYLYHWPLFVLTRSFGDSLELDGLRVVATLLIAAASYRWLELPIRRGLIRRARLTTDAAPAVVVAFGAATAIALFAGVLAVTSPTGPTADSADGTVAAAPPVDPGTAAPAVPPAPSSAPAAAPTPTVGVAPAPPPTSGAALVVGDSITLGCADALRTTLGANTLVDGKVGRQFSTATAIVAAWAGAHTGPIVIDLGANGTVQPRDVESVLAAAGDRRVVLVGVSVPRRWQGGNNAVLSAAAAGHAPKVVFVDWAAIVVAHPGSLGPDQVHPTGQGRTLLAKAVAGALRPA